jgi:hypothetical protein
MLPFRGGGLGGLRHTRAADISPVLVCVYLATRLELGQTRLGLDPAGVGVAAPSWLDRLELLERLAAVVAVADRAARRRAEQVLETCRRRTAVRTAEAALELH